MNFIKNIAQGNITPRAHKKMVRFGLGDYEREDFIIKVGGSFVQIQAGFEYLNVIQDIMAKCLEEDVELAGKIIAQASIEEKLASFDIEPIKADRKCRKVEIKCTLPSAKFVDFLESFRDANLMLKLSSGKYSLKCKASPPKPGSVSEKFLTAKFALADLDLLKQEFLFDKEIDSFKQIILKHTYVLEKIDIPKEYENDPVQARANSTRTGRILRTMVVDGTEEKSEIPFSKV